MAKNRDPRRGFVARWFHRLRRLNRLVFIGGLVVGVVKAVHSRSAGGSAGGTGHAGGGPGGSGRPAPVGGPAAPRLAASVAEPESDDPDLSASSAPSAVRTLISVPPLVDDDSTNESTASADGSNNVVVPLNDVDLADESDESDDSQAGPSTAPLLTIVSNAEADTDSDTGTGTGAPTSGGSWVAPLESGDCPDGYPVKANDNSGIYHVPGGRSYNRTVAERCYTSAEAAEADGYRPAKR